MEKKNNQTLLILKPDAIKKNKKWEILEMIENKGFEILRIKKAILSKKIAKDYFYKEHKKKPFFNELIDFISESPIIITILEGNNAIKKIREIIGNNDPEKAEEETIRRKYGEDILRNSVHASDSYSSFLKEKKIFFRNKEKFKSFQSFFSNLLLAIPIISIFSIIFISLTDFYKKNNWFSEEKTFSFIIIWYFFLFFISYIPLVNPFKKKSKKENNKEIKNKSYISI